MKTPVVFMFQPSEFEVVAPDKLSHWEEMMRNNVGVRAEAAGGIETISFCGMQECDCDVDNSFEPR
jgi:hypothetical protein